MKHTARCILLMTTLFLCMTLIAPNTWASEEPEAVLPSEELEAVLPSEGPFAEEEAEAPAEEEPAPPQDGATEYDVWIGGIRVTDENADSIVSGVSYDPSTRTLTLSDAKLSVDYDKNPEARMADAYGETVCAIYTQIPLKINLEGTNTVLAYGHDHSAAAIKSKNGLTIGGAGSLTATGSGGGNSVGIDCPSLWLNGGDVTIRSFTNAVSYVGINSWRLMGIGIFEGSLTAVGTPEALPVRRFSDKDFYLSEGYKIWIAKKTDGEGLEQIPLQTYLSNKPSAGYVVFTRETEPPAVHTHTPGEVVRENEIAATCRSLGSYDEVVYCTECGSVISRVTRYEDRSNEHDWGEWSVKKAPTDAEEGEEIRVCAQCGTEQTRPLPRLGDVDKDGAVTPADAALILADPGICAAVTADVNVDLEVNALDAVLVLGYSAGLIQKLPST